ncbi:Dual specificity protein phosphatase 18, partial [Galemys pyrenaicus]
CPSSSVLAASAYGLSQITSSLYISSGVAASNKLTLSSNQTTAVFNVSAAENTLYKDIQCPRAAHRLLCPMTSWAASPAQHCMEIKQDRPLLLCAAVVLQHPQFRSASHHPALEDDGWLHRTRHRLPSACQLTADFWELLLFGRNTVHVINYPMGMIPDVYEEVGLMGAK